MRAAAAAERFEEAAQLRDAMRTVQAVRERQQKMATAGLGDRDVFGVKVGDAARSSRCSWCGAAASSSASSCSADAARGAGGPEAVVAAALQQFYESRSPPPEIHVPVADRRRDVLEEWLSARAERKVRIVVPQRGDKRDLVELAQRNAELAYRARFEPGGAAPGTTALERLQRRCKLPALPRRIECFDISTIQGSETVASLVVCEDGRMAKGEYRKFRVRAQGPGPGSDSLPGDAREPARETARAPVPAPSFLDDFAAMEQVVRRRYAAVLEDGGPFPDLIVDRRRQGAAERRLRGARSGSACRTWWRSAWRRRRSSSSPATATSRSRSTAATRRCGCCSASATKRTASP